MPISLFAVSQPVFLRGLDNMSKILEKASAHAEARKIDPAVLFNYRLYPDMFPMARQVMIAADMAKGGMARLAGQEPPKYPDTETTFVELHARIRKTTDYLSTFKPEMLQGADERAVVVKLPGRELSFNGVSYLSGFVLPNFYFHLATAYDILRHCGVELGKTDFLGSL